MSQNQFNAEIIIVDDNQFQLKLLSHQLEMVGYESVMAFDNGQAALCYMTGRVLDSTVVILDLNMPNMDGLEFLQALKETNYSGALLLVSGEDERVVQSAETLALSYNLFVLGHLSKPAQQHQLQKYLNEFSAPKEALPDTGNQKVYTADRLRQAIKAGELTNVYQPKVLVSTGELKGIEALVRWEHPEDGEVLPDRFIHLAEENGLIDEIARQVLREAFYDSKLLKDLGMDITLAVNISMYNLNTREFISYLEKELQSSGLSPQDLILEITESRLMKDYLLVLDMLTRLRLRRVSLSIDDFGTGHSSMAQLRDIPFNELKIDGSFVHSACDNATLHGIFDGSLQTAKNLGIRTVAEGVEDEADWNFLENSDCDTAQGFFIGRPMKAMELVAWREQWTQRCAKIAV
ncbi:MAG: EAL domain-containing response regulator [Pseudohongiella sp.]|nr:EAL domain-containing response regulator [Pseudohongiella sp.]